jgi:hypothetical protein
MRAFGDIAVLAVLLGSVAVIASTLAIVLVGAVNIL